MQTGVDEDTLHTVKSRMDSMAFETRNFEHWGGEVTVLIRTKIT